MLTQSFADHFATEWIAAWNHHDMEAILAHYTDDFMMSSPKIATIANEPSGTLVGKAAIRAYWEKALARLPDLHFTLINTLVGADSIVLYYQNSLGFAAEFFLFNAEGKVVRAAAHYV